MPRNDNFISQGKLDSYHFTFEPCLQTTSWDNKQLKLVREAQNNWPTRIMSYELWCALTGYDSRDETGGEVFQQLLQWLLTEGSGSRHLTSVDDLIRYDTSLELIGYI